jgi:hypothetical protein
MGAKPDPDGFQVERKAFTLKRRLEHELQILDVPAAPSAESKDVLRIQGGNTIAAHPLPSNVSTGAGNNSWCVNAAGDMRWKREPSKETNRPNQLGPRATS